MKGFFKKNKKVIVISTIFAIGLYFLIWVWFLVDGFIPTGKELDKSDWLAFAGSFLAFIGTVALGALALWQNKKANHTNKSLQLMQINSAIIERDTAEVLSIKSAVHDTILSFDINIFAYIFPNISAFDMPSIIRDIQNARRNAYNSGVNLELVKYFNKCQEKCETCDKDCDIKQKPKEYRDKLLVFKDFYYKQYLSKYLDTVDKLHDILLKRNRMLQLSTFNNQQLDEARMKNNNRRENYKESLKDCLEEAESLVRIGKSQDEVNEFVKQRMEQINSTSDMAQKVIDQILDQITANLEYKYSDEDLVKDFEIIKSDVDFLVNSGYFQLTTKAYGFIAQCESEINNNYSDLLKTIKMEATTND